MERAERLAKVKATRAQEKAIIAKLKAKINDIADACGLDEERMARRVQAALRAEYGRINGMINLLAAVCKWPAEQGDGASVSANQLLIEKEMGIDLMLLEDISTFKGYHTFHTDELEIIEGIKPQFDSYSDHCSLLLEDIGFERAAAEIEPSRWAAAEQRAIKKTKEDVLELRQAVADHNAKLLDV